MVSRAPVDAGGGELAALTLVSHELCPYVQRAAIVLAEKAVSYRRRYVDLSAKPEWFKAVSPLGKVPVLLVGEAPLFESAVICEYLDETYAPRLHPESPLERARHRGWIEFASATLTSIAAFYIASDENILAIRRDDLAARFERVEAALGEGPYFAGTRFGMVDAAFAPVFRYFDVFERIGEFGFFVDTPKVRNWRASLATRESVRGAVKADYLRRLADFLCSRGSALSARLAQAA
jgi:glutathione S-transferase